MEKNKHLIDYIAGTGTKQAALAGSVGVTNGYMSLLVSGLRAPSLKVAIAIERATGGKVPASSWERAA